MKNIIASVFIVLAAVLTGCATSDSVATTANGPRISGYVDTSAGKHF